MKTWLLAMLLFPLAGALVQPLCGRLFGLGSGNPADRGHWAAIVACAAVALSLCAAVAVLVLAQGRTSALALCPWFGMDGFTAQASLLYDPLAGFMALTVTFVSLLIHIYSLAFMRGEQGLGRYFCFLNLFVFFMLLITLADDLLFLFLGWEGVGFCSYSLIGFWHRKTANVVAGGKAFIFTRLGDLGLVAALAVMAGLWGASSLSLVAAKAASLDPGTAQALGFLILLAALGKSAQLPFSAWLPDAMAGTTPVSALIHAATMVTAGAYLLLRLSPLLAQAPLVLEATALVGAVTALYGALAALAQKDIKRVLAYSTISQVGYMFLAAGCGDVPGCLFQLMSHAFFKSLLFMVAGCLIRAGGGEHDIFKLGRMASRLRRELPGVCILFACGAVSLAALPFTAGYFSKGRILADVLGLPGWPYAVSAVLALAAAFVTAVYAVRLVYVVLAGQARESAPASVRGADVAGINRMAGVLWPLAILSLGFGFVNPPHFLGLTAWLDAALANAPSLPAPALSFRFEPALAAFEAALALAGLWLARRLYGPGQRGTPARTGLDGTGMLASGFGLDALYVTVVAGPYRRLALLVASSLDQTVLDGGVTKGAGAFLAFSKAVSGLARGRITDSLAALLAAMAAALIYLASRLG